MNVTTFRLCDPLLEFIDDPIYGKQKVIYQIPTLPAYAITDVQLTLDKIPYQDSSINNYDYELLDNSVEIIAHHMNIFGAPSGVLTVYHRGIKDYRLLFPHVKTGLLQARLATFAEEAEKAFESQSWISYCLMVGGVLEGLLYDQFSIENFKKLIEIASDRKILSAEEASLINEIRLARNKIHANRYKESVVERKTALELSVAYDRLIKRAWI